MRLSELSGKEIVDVNRAERLGILGQTDLEIDETGQITSLIIPSVKWFGLLRNGSEIRVPWEHIKKIGADMVIIDFQEGLSRKDGEHMDG
ncbi:YlmC/YmxH family sporulation protein [Peribacillus frigoritolerans]|uniref:YlmC/YmxH family sporulation protein n=1 Tax=Peribacillus frigoritolerans TaxID=450367 RepID=UPI002079D3EA|nr:YlmC/YmxH family sporulation protein [Peribacillus frigoritolerans]USK66789.1 YlmC/YmxH family sporulation protein [Peribacillus frigoritolerans]